jgi:hypothetical protein
VEDIVDTARDELQLCRGQGFFRVRLVGENMPLREPCQLVQRTQRLMQVGSGNIQQRDFTVHEIAGE